MRNGNRPPRACARACDTCQRKRAKCSGTKPCDRCVANDEQCSFQPHVREFKANLRARIKELEKAERDTNVIFEVLRDGGRRDASRAVMDALRDNVPLDIIAASLSAVQDENLAPGPGVGGEDDDGLASSSNLPRISTKPYSDMDSTARSSSSSSAGGLQFSPASSTTTESTLWTMPPLQNDALPDPKFVLHLNNLPSIQESTYAAMDCWPFDNGAALGMGNMTDMQQQSSYDISEGLVPLHGGSPPLVADMYSFDFLATGRRFKRAEQVGVGGGRCSFAGENWKSRGS